MLRLNIAAADLNRCELIASNSAVEKFPSPCFRIKGPGRTKFHDWNSKRPIVFTDLKYGASRIFGLQRDLRFCPCLRGKLFQYFPLARWFTPAFAAAAPMTLDWVSGYFGK